MPEPASLSPVQDMPELSQDCDLFMPSLIRELAGALEEVVGLKDAAGAQG